MTAKGKINASTVQAGDRIIVQAKAYAAGDTCSPSRTKTGEGVSVARVTSKAKCTSQRGYMVYTTAGSFYAEPIQTMWLAPEDAAGIKRAHAEAEAEDARLDNENADRILAHEDEARKNAVAEAQTAQVEGWLARHREQGTPRRNWSLIEDGRQADHAEALAENEARIQAGVSQVMAFANRHNFKAPLTANTVRIMVTTDHAEALAEDAAREACPLLINDELTLNSQDGKVYNMNNDDEDMPGRNEAHRKLAEATEGMLAAETQPGDLVQVYPLSGRRPGATVRVDEVLPDGAVIGRSVTAREATGSSVVQLLEKVWARIRQNHPDLPEVIFITGSGLVNASKWGHFRADGWKGRDGSSPTRHEMMIAGETMAKGAKQLLQTMLHEGAHTLARVRGKQDTSRQGRWHNQTFRKMAEEMGLEHRAHSADSAHGYSFVTPTDATLAAYADLLADLDREIHLVCHLPGWMGGTDEEDQGGEKITGKPKGDEKSSGNLKATCQCEEPIIIRLSRKVLDLAVVKCDACGELFTTAER